MIGEFTFETLSYMQEKYILQHMESIKYQITHYGEGIKCHYILCDDHSTDNTVPLIKKWLDQNPGLFVDVKISVNTENIGTVPNFVKALRQIGTEHFKILAGDDLFYKNNIFEACGKRDIILTPLIETDQNLNVLSYINPVNIELICVPDSKIKQVCSEKLKYWCTLDTGGFFPRHGIYTEELYEVLSHYHWIEDAPEYAYFFNLSDISVGFDPTPYVIYRRDVGISTDNEHSKRREYEDELSYVIKNVYVHYSEKYKTINPYRYLNRIKRFMRTYSIGSRKKIDSFYEYMEKEAGGCAGYAKELNKSIQRYDF